MTDFKSISKHEHPVLFCEKSCHGWGNYYAWGPSDELSLNIEDDFSKLVNFVDRNTGSFIAGFISWEAGVKQLGITPMHVDSVLPAIYFCAYPTYNTFTALPQPNNKAVHSEFVPVISRKQYETSFHTIKHHIVAGDIYQLNYTHPLTAKTESDSKSLFLKLYSQNPVNFAAFLEHDQWAIHSLSPEKFVSIKNDRIISEPIKGTRPRGKTPHEDEHLLKELLASEKEQAELFMIVDLLRNDLGKVCKTDSIIVSSNKAVKKLPKVFHTYSVISGSLKKTVHPMEALLSMSPGGSISGCPKKRAVEIIQQLEADARGIYTGSMGYILPDGTTHFNIAIRTVIQKGENLVLGVGGGITIESNEKEEFQESFAKAASFQP